MNFDHQSRMILEAERRLATYLEFERLHGRRLQQVAKDALERERLFEAALPEFSTVYRSIIQNLLPAVDKFREMERSSPVMSFVADAHSGLSAVLASRNVGKIVAAGIAFGPQWQDNITAYQQLAGKIVGQELALKSHYATIAESAYLAQERLLRVPWDAIGGAMNIGLSEFSAVTDGFTTLTDEYRVLMQSFDARENFIESFPPIISAGPPIEIFTSARVLEALSGPSAENESFNVDREAEAQLEYEIEATTEELLAALSPELRSVWLGGKKALASDNPDRGRHVVVSLRELLTHVLHIIAPNEEIQSWTSNPSHFHEGRPTREARVLYICRGVDHGPFSKFVNADVRATIEFMNLFQRGTHQLEVLFSDQQLRALLTRAESLLRFLLLTYRINK